MAVFDADHPRESLLVMTPKTATRDLGGRGRRGCIVIYRFGAIDKEPFSDVLREGCPTDEAQRTFIYNLQGKMRGTYNRGDCRRHFFVFKKTIDLHFRWGAVMVGRQRKGSLGFGGEVGEGGLKVNGKFGFENYRSVIQGWRVGLTVRGKWSVERREGW